MTIEGRLVTSSQERGEKLGISAAQIRKDLSQFGEFGKQGTGYDIRYLLEQISQILHVDHEWEIAIVGAGDIGSAVARYKGFTNRCFRVTMIYNNEHEKIGIIIDKFKIKNIRKMGAANSETKITISIVAVTVTDAENICE